MAPVEVWLLLQEGVVIILFGNLVPFPGWAAEIADPVIGRPAVSGRIAPDVPVSFLIFLGRAALDEPWMLVRGVIGHEVEQNLEPPPMGLRQQVVEVCQAAEAWIYIAIVGNVIAEINHRRRVNGRDPDRLDPKADKIVEPLLYPFEVAYTVVVSVLKGARVDLIDHACLPPERGHANRALGVCVDCRLLITWCCQNYSILRFDTAARIRAVASNSVLVAIRSRRIFAVPLDLAYRSNLMLSPELGGRLDLRLNSSRRGQCPLRVKKPTFERFRMAGNRCIMPTS